MPDLYAYFAESLVGVFRDHGDDGAVFEYSTSPGTTPLSLSLPFDGPHADGAASAFLDNLLPDLSRRRAATRAGG